MRISPLIKCLCLVLLPALWSCHDQGPAIIEDDIASGGQTTVYGNYISIFEQPAANLTQAELDLHELADKAFGDQFVTSPALINAGLGPLFNQNSCESCHLSNGRSPFPSTGDDLKGLLIRLSLAGEGDHGQPVDIPGYGRQLQTKAVFGKSKEADVTWEEEISNEQFPDGHSTDLSRPIFHLENLYAPLPAGILMSPGWLHL